MQRNRIPAHHQITLLVRKGALIGSIVFCIAEAQFRDYGGNAAGGSDQIGHANIIANSGTQKQNPRALLSLEVAYYL